jgi:hypothetical protein
MELAVALILDAKFGSRLRAVSPKTITWACESPENRAVATGIWEELINLKDKRPDPLTLFCYSENASAEKNLINILPDIESHHRWTVLEVYGADLTEEVRTVLCRDYGTIEFTKTPTGFRASR